MQSRQSPHRFRVRTSGATYIGVPQMVFIAPSAARLARPKSTILIPSVMFPSVDSNRFSSFKSRCAIPRACR